MVKAAAVVDDEEPPVAVIVPDELIIAVGQPFTFSGARSTDNDNIAIYEWDFGDGDTAAGMMPTHIYNAAGDFTITLTVTDDTGNTGTATATMTVHDVTTGESGYTLATFAVVDAAKQTTPPIGGATIFVKSADGSFETSAATASDGIATLLLENGSYTVTVTKGGYMPRTFALDANAETGVLERTVGLSTVSMVTGEITVTEMTIEEIEEVGIDTSDPNNQHVSKFEVVMEFEVGDVTYELPVAYYKNEAGTFLHGGGSGGYTGEFVANGELTTGEGPGGPVNVAVYPISERFFLVIYGEARWLKEMYNVELVVMNNSYTDTIEDMTAALELPDGMSLAAMVDGCQSLDVEMGSIGIKDSGSEKAVANWYVRGDEEGEYHLSATVTGTNLSEDGVSEPFEQTFTTSEPVKVYAGKALKLFISAADRTYRGQEYHVQFELKNVSNKSLYNLSFGITGASQFQVATVAGFNTGRVWSHEDFGDSATVGVGELAPGESIVIDFSTPIWFRSVYDVGPTSVEYLLKNVFVTTLEGSTTEIPYEIIINPSPKTAVFPVTEDMADDDIYVIVEEIREEETLAPGETRQYRIKAPRSGQTMATLHLENGVFTGARAAGVIAVSADSDNYRVEEDGSVTITGDVTLTVTGTSAGTAAMTIRYNDGDVYTVDYTVSGDPVVDAKLTINPPDSTEIAIPDTGSETVTLTAAYTENGTDLPLPQGVLWSVEGEPAGVTIQDGVLTVGSTAEPGTVTVCVTYGALKDELILTLTKVMPVVTAVTISRGDAALTEDNLAVPMSGSKEFVYTAAVADQFGNPMDADVVWSNDNTLTGVAVTDGAVTIAAETQTGSFTLTVTEPVSGIKADVTIHIKALAMDWSSIQAIIEAADYIYGDRSDKAALPATGTATCLGNHTGTFSYVDGDAIQPAGIGSITVKFRVDDSDPIFGGAELEQAFEVAVAKRELTVQIQDSTRSYGSDNPDFAHEITAGELVGDDGLTVTFSCDADNNTPAGETAQITGNVDDDNYNVTVLPGTLAIEQAVVSASDISDGTISIQKSYDGMTVLSVDGTLAVTGVNSETVTLTVTAPGEYPDSAAGSYTIALTLGELSSDNYRLAEGLVSYEFTGAVILPASYGFDVPDEQSVNAGDSLNALSRPAKGSGVNGETVDGKFAWFADSDMTQQATDAILAVPGTVILYWSFTADNGNYSGEPVTGEVAVTVIGMEAPVLVSIKITAMPAKTEYKTKEKLALAGLEVTAVYSDGSEKPIEGYTANPADGSVFSTSGKKAVTVTYVEDDVQMITTFTVNVKADSVGQAVVEVVAEVVKAVVNTVSKIISWLSKWF